MAFFVYELREPLVRQSGPDTIGWMLEMLYDPF